MKRKAHSILVVEDNEELLQLMVKLLSREYNVFKAENGKEGVTILENEDIDLIVSDVMMPEMDGLEMLQSIRKDFQISHIPVIILTAKNDEGAKTKAITLGAKRLHHQTFQ